MDPNPLTPEQLAEILWGPPDSSPVGGFKPGDVVSVRGVVERSPAPKALSVFVRFPAGHADWARPEDLTLIERPAPPEPDWRPGDLAEDDAGDTYVLRPNYSDGTAWWRVLDGARFDRDEIPGRLHKLTVTREDEAQ